MTGPASDCEGSPSLFKLRILSESCLHVCLDLTLEYDQVVLKGTRGNCGAWILLRGLIGVGAGPGGSTVQGSVTQVLIGVLPLLFLEHTVLLLQSHR